MTIVIEHAAIDRPWEKIHADLGVSPPEPVETPLGELVARAATLVPKHAALFYEGRRIDYAALNREACRLADALARHGLSKGDVIAVHLPNTPQFVIALVAASKLGAITCGVSTLLTGRELRFQLADSGARVLLTLDTLHETRVATLEDFPTAVSLVIVTQLADYTTPVPFEPPPIAGVETVRLLDFVAGRSEDFAQVPTSGDDVFLLQYTGGTTGRPKGALLSVRTVMTNPISANIYAPYIYGEERMATPFPFFHIGGIGGLVGALAAGAEYLVLTNPRDIDKFIDQLAQLRPTRLGAIPTFYQLLLNHPRCKDIDFGALVLAVTGGAPIAAADRARLDLLFGPEKLADYFGMTETASVYLCNPPARCKPAALGIPVPGADVRIVDVETGRKVLPFGEPGEIITAGIHLMQGYKGRPDETAHALRPQDGRTWMYTGDVGFMDEDGYVHLCDRSKDMLIVGGFKVFSIEVEEVVREIDFVASAALIATPDRDRPGNDIVNLFVQPKPTMASQSEADVREAVLAHCRQQLAPYKVPKRIHILPSLPLTTIGKINKLALRELAAQTDASA